MSDEQLKNPIEKTMKVTGMTLEMLAKHLGITTEIITYYKEFPDEIPSGKLKKISKITGISIEQLCGEEQEYIKGPKLKPTYEKLYNRLKKAIDLAESQKRKLENVGIDVKLEAFEPIKNEVLETLVNTLEIAKKQGKRPTLCAFGQSDTGKSTLTNFILQENIAPAFYTPMTTVPTYFFHISEKPKYALNENAIVFGRMRDSNLPKYEHEYFDDEEKARPYILEMGDYSSIINSFGTRDGEYYDNNNLEISEIVVFLDNEILKEFTFVDIPGFGSGDKRDDIGLTMDMNKIDVIFFLSISGGFFRDQEISVLKQILSSRKSLDSIYILATHAKAVGDPEKIEKIIKSGCERLISSMTDIELQALSISRENYEELENRFFGFEAFNDFYCNKINKDFEKIIPKIIKNKLTYSINSLKKASEKYRKEYEEKMYKYDIMISDNSKKSSSDEKFKEEISKKFKEIKEKMYKTLNECRTKSIENFTQEYNNVINEEFIICELKRRKIKNKKADIESFSSYLCSEINDKLKLNLKDNSEKFSNDINSCINSYKETWSNGFEANKINIDMSGFDFFKAFAAGLSGVGVYGALALWATIVAEGSNLGAYILVAKVVSALSAIGISLGGTASVATFVASIGGPVTLGVAIAIISAISVFAIFTGNWRKIVARKFVKICKKEEVEKQCVEYIGKYWSDTKIALDACLETLELKAMNYYKNQKAIINLNYSNLEKNINQFKEVYTIAIEIYKDIENC